MATVAEMVLDHCIELVENLVKNLVPWYKPFADVASASVSKELPALGGISAENAMPLHLHFCRKKR
jgi:hypothetical protein